MGSRLEDYQALIDDLVGIRPSVDSQRVRLEQPWPDLPENRSTNDFLSGLSADGKEALAQMLQQARDGGIHDVLVYLSDEINLNGLRLVRNGNELPIEPFGTQLYYDWVSRSEGDPWPEPDPHSL